VKVKELECDTDFTTGESWSDIDEMISNDGTKEIRLKKTSNGLFWYFRDCCGSGAWSVLEPSDDASIDYTVPVEFGDALHADLKGDGAACDQVGFKVNKPGP